MAKVTRVELNNLLKVHANSIMDELKAKGITFPENVNIIVKITGSRDAYEWARVINPIPEGK